MWSSILLIFVQFKFNQAYAHRFVGYLGEQAFQIYSELVDQIEQGELPEFDVPAPEPVRLYYRLPEDARLRDVLLAIRADKKYHAEKNHVFSKLSSFRKANNPFLPGGGAAESS